MYSVERIAAFCQIFFASPHCTFLVNADHRQGRLLIGRSKVRGQVPQGVKPELVFGLVPKAEAESRFKQRVAGANQRLDLDHGVTPSS